MKQGSTASPSQSSVVVTTCVALDDRAQSTVEDVIAKLIHQNVAISYVVDATLLGGMQIEHNGALIDMSLKTQLAELTQKLRTM